MLKQKKLYGQFFNQSYKEEKWKIWDMEMKAIPVVVGSLGKTPNKLKIRLSDIGIETRIVDMQKTTILYFARILQNILEVWEILLAQNLK